MDLPVKHFVAVGGKSVCKFTESAIEKTMLQHNHTGESAVKWNSIILVISGSETKTTESISVSDTQILPENLFPPTNYFRFASAAVALNYSLYITSGLTWKNPTEICSYVLRHYTWRQYDKMNFNRNGHALVFMCDVTYILAQNVPQEESVIGFNTCTYKTKTLPQMIYPRSNVVALVFDH